MGRDVDFSEIWMFVFDSIFTLKKSFFFFYFLKWPLAIHIWFVTPVKIQSLEFLGSLSDFALLIKLIKSKHLLEIAPSGSGNAFDWFPR